MLTPLRAWMKQDGIDVLLFPYNDRFQSEYLPPHDDRLAWLTGFTGSWGFAIITGEQAVLFVDGRYILQAPQQVDTALWQVIDVAQQRPSEWLTANLKRDQTVGLEGWRFTGNALQQWQTAIARRKGVLRQLDGDITEFLWSGRPQAQTAPAFLQSLDHAGKTAADKIAQLQDVLSREGLDGYLVTDPGHVCWLLNLRGRDVAHTPLLLCMAFVADDGTILLFTDTVKISDELTQKFGRTVTVYGFDAMQAALVDHPAGTIGTDPNHAPSILTQALRTAGKDVHNVASPIELLRAIKNEAEITGARNAHRRDAVAVMETLHWLQTHDAVTQVTEQGVIDHLHGRRAAQDLYVEDSFATIAGSGAHGAIVHYHVTRDSDSALQNDSLLLLDSGGQYLDGTTDITRTIAIGQPTPEMIADYTSVLQGHIALSRTRFPVGTSGAALDALARAPLWQQGRHYTHGTGHGIGSFMGVHEGPQGFSPKSPAPLAVGMLITNEPGYYKTDAYGIRLENIMLVVDKAMDGDDRPMLGFEPLTLVPFESALIDFARLNEAEKNWLRDYHTIVRDTMLPLLSDELQDWLRDKVAAFIAL